MCSVLWLKIYVKKRTALGTCLARVTRYVQLSIWLALGETVKFSFGVDCNGFHFKYTAYSEPDRADFIERHVALWQADHPPGWRRVSRFKLHD